MDNNDEVVIKKIVVKPKQKLSYQSHKKRNELWFIVFGEAIVTKNDEQFKLGKSDFIYIKIGDKHRIENTDNDNDLILIEISQPEFDENDNMRYEDDYNRI